MQTPNRPWSLCASLVLVGVTACEPDLSAAVPVDGGAPAHQGETDGGVKVANPVVDAAAHPKPRVDASNADARAPVSIPENGQSDGSVDATLVLDATPPHDGSSPPSDASEASNARDASSEADPIVYVSPEGGTLQPAVSRSLALTSDGASLWVVNQDSDSVSQIDVASRTLLREILLADQAPAVDPTTSRFEPQVRPRALALVEGAQKLYVAGQSANAVVVVSLVTGAIVKTISVGAEPTSVVASPDGRSVFVVSHEAALVQQIDTTTDTVTRTVTVAEHPWGASLSGDGSRLYVTHLLRGAGVTVLDTNSLTVSLATPFADQAPDPSGNVLIPSGQVRGVYAAVPQPGTGALWAPHLLLDTATPQPTLNYESTVFPTISLLTAAAIPNQRLLFQAPGVPPFPGAALWDSCSGPRDVAFTPDGSLALVVMAASEDVMLFDANARVEIGIVRSTPSALVEGIVVDSTGTHAYLQGRDTHDVTVLSLSRGTVDGGFVDARAPDGSAVATLAVDGAPIDSIVSDPMPANLRRGERLFYSANSSAFPITTDYRVSCATCHLEGGTSAVTWYFLQGPRDTPSNAGGPINTGFLFRQAARSDVVQYDETIRNEQGGSYDRTNPAELPDLQSLAAFVNYAIPFPQNPYLSPDGTLTPSQANGQQLFVARGCPTCHTGAYLTDSASGNPTLDLSGPVLLHPTGTCVTTGPYPDEPSTDVDGNARAACMFDTPTLRGLFATAPYFHDGSAATLEQAVGEFTGSDQADVIHYLQTL